MCKVEEKWVKINFYKFIGCIGEKKKDEYNFWVIFQQFKKKKNLLKKCKNGFGPLPKLYCEFVLQALQLYCKRQGWKNCREKKNCIAIPFLYCREEGLRVGKCIAIHYIVLQRRNGLQENCIAI